MKLNGLQHIGIPTNNFQESKRFYQSLGFDIINQEKNGASNVAFFDLNGTIIEIWEDAANSTKGAIDHIALDTDNIEEAFLEINFLGYPLIDKEIQELPFWEKGIRYFNFSGPNNEIIEISQRNK